jgi:hypothetical protein
VSREDTVHSVPCEPRWQADIRFSLSFQNRLILQRKPSPTVLVNIVSLRYLSAPPRDIGNARFQLRSSKRFPRLSQVIRRSASRTISLPTPALSQSHNRGSDIIASDNRFPRAALSSVKLRIGVSDDHSMQRRNRSICAMANGITERPLPIAVKLLKF